MLEIYLLGMAISLILIILTLVYFIYTDKVNIICGADILLILILVILSWISVFGGTILLIASSIVYLDDKLENITIWEKK